jgi:hypothetical protein
VFILDRFWPNGSPYGPRRYIFPWGHVLPKSSVSFKSSTQRRVVKSWTGYSHSVPCVWCLNTALHICGWTFYLPLCGLICSLAFTQIRVPMTSYTSQYMQTFLSALGASFLCPASLGCKREHYAGHLSANHKTHTMEYVGIGGR